VNRHPKVLPRWIRSVSSGKDLGRQAMAEPKDSRTTGDRLDRSYIFTAMRNRSAQSVGLGAGTPPCSRRVTAPPLHGGTPTRLTEPEPPPVAHQDQTVFRPMPVAARDRLQIGYKPRHQTLANVGQHHPTFPRATGRPDHEGTGRRSPSGATSLNAARHKQNMPSPGGQVSRMAASCVEGCPWGAVRSGLRQVDRMLHGSQRARSSPRAGERSPRSTREQPGPATQHVPSYFRPLPAATHTRRPDARRGRSPIIGTRENAEQRALL
jgi:hypothetical protein